MKRFSIYMAFCLFSLLSLAQTQPTTLYLLPGLGSTSHLFDRMVFDSQYTIKHINYPVPDSGATMTSYAHVLAIQIDTTEPFALIGTSIGGMLAVELADILNPTKVFIIASAKTRDELPPRYTFQRAIPIHKLVGENLIKNSTRFLQPIVEPDSKCDQNVYQAMLDDKDPMFMKRAVEMILLWDRTNYSDPVVHIHGTKDHTLPFRCVDADYVIEDGSHMMTLTRADEILQIIQFELE